MKEAWLLLAGAFFRSKPWPPPHPAPIGRFSRRTTGGDETQACGGCHGDRLLGMGDVPIIAGRSPVYIARQIYSFKNDVRKGPMAEIMKGVVDKLPDEDMIAVSSYVSSLNPF